MSYTPIKIPELRCSLFLNRVLLPNDLYKVEGRTPVSVHHVIQYKKVKRRGDLQSHIKSNSYKVVQNTDTHSPGRYMISETIYFFNALHYPSFQVFWSLHTIGKAFNTQRLNHDLTNINIPVVFIYNKKESLNINIFLYTNQILSLAIS